MNEHLTTSLWTHFSSPTSITGNFSCIKRTLPCKCVPAYVFIHIRLREVWLVIETTIDTFFPPEVYPKLPAIKNAKFCYSRQRLEMIFFLCSGIGHMLSYIFCREIYNFFLLLLSIFENCFLTWSRENSAIFICVQKMIGRVHNSFFFLFFPSLFSWFQAVFSPWRIEIFNWLQT